MSQKQEELYKEKNERVRCLTSSRLNGKASKYVINCTKDLPINYVNEESFGSKLKSNNYFIPKSCNLNFHEDRVEFLLEIANVSLSKIEIENKVIYYKFNNDAVQLPIIQSNQVPTDKKVHQIIVCGNIKDCLLHLFEPLDKKFVLGISCTIGDKKASFCFSASLPAFDRQTKWKTKLTNEYTPVEVCGPEILALYEKTFKSYAIISKDGTDKLDKLLKYKNSQVEDRFNSLDFINMFKHMIAIEDLESCTEMQKHSLDSVNIYSYNQLPSNLKIIVDKNLREIVPEDEKIEFVKSIYVIQAPKKLPNDVLECYSINFTDKVHHQLYGKDKTKMKTFLKHGEIKYIFGDLILFCTSQSISFIENIFKFHVEFLPNRISTRVTQRALEDIEHSELRPYLKAFEMKNLPMISTTCYKNFNWFNSSMNDNEEQRHAVENIVNCTSFPSPFVIFGGPGTGKSSTVVEAIAQIVKLKPEAHILVTASSNSACDELGNRLLSYVSINKILRLYSPSFETKLKKVDKVLQKISNLRFAKTRHHPSYEEVSTARVIIATLINTGRFVSANFPTDHFDYIFIDEAGSVCEPQCYIPINGLGIKSRKINAQIVLAGDHKQLGPVVKNTFAESMGLETSLMERLMNTDKKYQRVNGRYNENFVVQLRKNYRSHPAIIHFSNVHFYSSQLIPVCSDKTKNFALDKKILTNNPQFPVVFHNSALPSEAVGTSSKNEEELLIVASYLNTILIYGLCGNKIDQTDIGIITPYSGQRDRMCQLFSDKFKNVEIGTVDSFQGREKKIILVSCVRSGTNHVGFLSNQKRLNVALTRAQSLLIVIGNANTLQKCNIWKNFIVYCKENNAFYGKGVKSSNKNSKKNGKEGKSNNVKEIVKKISVIQL